MLLNFLEKDYTAEPYISIFLKQQATNAQERVDVMTTMAINTVFDKAFQLYKLNKNNVNVTPNKKDPRFAFSCAKIINKKNCFALVI